MSNWRFCWVNRIIQEAQRAERLHPIWPDDIIHAAAIVAEESGELVQAALNHVYADTPRERIKTEAIQTAATCLRLLEHLEVSS